MNCLLILSLAVLGASAAPCGLTFNTVPQGCGVSINSVSQGCESALQGRNLFAQTPVIEYPTSVFPPTVPPTSVSQSCHCLKTLVRPQIRNEIITVPQVDRIVRVVPSPVIEAVTVDLGTNNSPAVGNSPVATYGINSGVSGVTGVVEGVTGIVSGSYPRIVEGVVGGSSFQGFGGVITSGNSGCGCGSNIIV